VRASLELFERYIRSVVIVMGLTRTAIMIFTLILHLLMFILPSPCTLNWVVARPLLRLLEAVNHG